MTLYLFGRLLLGTAGPLAVGYTAWLILGAAKGGQR